MNRTTYVFGCYETVVHEVINWRLCADVVKAVGSFKRLVHRMMHYRRRECVETNEVRHFAAILEIKNDYNQTLHRSAANVCIT